MLTLDSTKDLKRLYNPPVKEVVLVEVPRMNFLMVDGQGNPNTSQEYRQAVEALYSLSYTLKFMIKKGPEGIDYKVDPLEGLWWVDNMAEFSLENKEVWKWTMLIMQSEWVTVELLEQARGEAVKKKKELADTLGKVRFESFEEGLAVQVMHTGPYSAEGPTVERLHKFAWAQGYRLHQKHHEIYLSDPRKAAPEKMKTIVRQPVIKG